MHPEGSDNMGAFITPVSNGSFFSYLASVDKVPDRIIKGAINTLKALNGAG